MKVISYRKDGVEGVGIMVDEVNCVSLGASMPDLYLDVVLTHSL